MTQHVDAAGDLPMLSASQAERLRELTSTYFLARYGVRPTIEAGVVEHDGHRNPLTTLAQKLRPDAGGAVAAADRRALRPP